MGRGGHLFGVWCQVWTYNEETSLVRKHQYVYTHFFFTLEEVERNCNFKINVNARTVIMVKEFRVDRLVACRGI